MSMFIRFLLSLCFLLLNGQGSMYAHAGKNYPVCTKQLSERVLTELQGGQTLVVKPTLQHEAEKESGVVDDVPDTEDEKDDDETTPFKKYVTAYNYLTSLLEDRVTVRYNSPLNNHSFFCKHFSFSSSGRYIVYRVIRI